MPIDKYEPIVGKKVISRIRKDAKPLQGKTLLHVNSTKVGGGVAEILNALVPLLNDIGIRTDWQVLKGNQPFFVITKSFHNGLQGEPTLLSRKKKQLYLQANKNSKIKFDHDFIVIHDPQPLPLIERKGRQHWVWRCHIDLSKPDKELWNYLSGFVRNYDRWIVSKRSFTKRIGVPRSIIAPSIDPLSAKNREMGVQEQRRILKKYRIPLDKPIITQVSRFDKWKDPLGVIRSYRLVKKKADCRLVLLGNTAHDDPEGAAIYEQVMQAAKEDGDILVININDDLLVNALQRHSHVVIQKSLREGFGLTVTEALWKGTPVVATRVGGIPLQLKNGRNGYLVTSERGCAKAVIKLLSNKKLRERLGRNGTKTVRKKFLITRHLHDYVKLLRKLQK